MTAEAEVTFRLLMAVISGMVFACAGFSGRADTWLPATAKTYLSSNGEFRFTVTPRDIRSPLAYFEDKIESVEPAGQTPDGAQKVRGKLERQALSGLWETVWDQTLVNEISPLSALVSDGGEHVVTFDNWHSAGWGGDAVVIYNSDGRPVRSLALTDFLPEAFFEALPRSVSSIWWSGDHRIEGDRLILQVVVPTSSTPGSDERFVEIAVSLTTGQVQPPEGDAWEDALSVAQTVNAARAEAEARRRAERIAPLLGPKENTEREWHGYLREAFARLYEGDDEFASAATKVLRTKTAENYDQSLGYLRDALLDPDYDGNVAIGSTSEFNLSDVLISLGAEIPPGSLDGNVLYVAVSDSAWPAIRDALSGSGADLRQLDPTEPIPQRPDRLPEYSQ